MSKQNGFTIIEVCVAIGIVAIGILTALSILLPTVVWSHTAKNDLKVIDATISSIQDYNAGCLFSTYSKKIYNGYYTREYGGWVDTNGKEHAVNLPVINPLTNKPYEAPHPLAGRLIDADPQSGTNDDPIIKLVVCLYRR